MPELKLEFVEDDRLQGEGPFWCCSTVGDLVVGYRGGQIAILNARTRQLEFVEDDRLPGPFLCCSTVGDLVVGLPTNAGKIATLSVSYAFSRDPRSDDSSLHWLHASVLPRLSHYLEFGLHDLPAEHPKFLFARRLFRETAARHRINLLAVNFGPAPRLEVVKVAELSNARLLQKYNNSLDDLVGRHREDGCDPIPLLQSLKLDLGAQAADAVDVNEHFAFHGATEDVIRQICKSGFDPQRGGEGAGKMFGVAAYFAANVSKSDIYTEDFTNQRLARAAERHIIIARVALGKSFRTTTPHADWHRAPDGYDSVWAASREHGGCVDHAEMMVYKEQQALPILLVTYRHVCQELCAECMKRPA